MLTCNTEAVPKKILEIMNVDGLTRENVASHLQKYRLYLKRLAETAGPGSAPRGRPAAASITVAASGDMRRDVCGNGGRDGCERAG